MLEFKVMRRRLLAASILVVVGLSACSQSEVRDAGQLARPEGTPSSGKALRSTNARTGVAAKTRHPDAPRDSAYKVRAVSAWASDQKWAGGLIRASGTGAAGGSFYPVAAQSGSEPSHDDVSRSRASGRFTSENLDQSFDPIYPGAWRGDPDKPLLLAAAPEPPQAEKSAQCAAFEKDADADLGEVMQAGCEPTLAQMSALMDNPLGNVAMLFTQVDLYRMKNPVNDKTANKWNYMGIAQFPKAVSKDWNLINRVVWNVPSMPLDQGKIDRAADRASRGFGSGSGGAVLPPSSGGPAPIDLFDGRTTGFGDMYYVALFSPKKPIKLSGGGKFVWGAGFDVGFPTATDDILGTGKWLAGPSALGVYLGRKWKIGALLQHYWDFAGDDDRDDVNMTNLQYFYMYSLNETTSIGAAPNIIANWEQDSDNAITLPVGLGINKTFQFGKVPVRFGAEVYYSAVTPDDEVGAEWNFRFYMIPAAPAALFKWMTTPIFSGG